MFQKFKAAVENHSVKLIKTLRSDNGTEYTSHEFEAFLQKSSIHHQLTVTYTPQQNGISERKNKHILEIARALLTEAKAPR